MRMIVKAVWLSSLLFAGAKASAEQFAMPMGAQSFGSAPMSYGAPTVTVRTRTTVTMPIASVQPSGGCYTGTCGGGYAPIPTPYYGGGMHAGPSYPMGGGSCGMGGGCYGGGGYGGGYGGGGCGYPYPPRRPAQVCLRRGQMIPGACNAQAVRQYRPFSLNLGFAGFGGMFNMGLNTFI